MGLIQLPWLCYKWWDKFFLTKRWKGTVESLYCWLMVVEGSNPMTTWGRPLEDSFVGVSVATGCSVPTGIPAHHRHWPACLEALQNLGICLDLLQTWNWVVIQSTCLNVHVYVKTLFATSGQLQNWLTKYEAIRPVLELTTRFMG